MTTDRELRDSIAAIGPLLPLLVWQNRVIDGARRQAVCAELGLAAPQRRLGSIEEACTALWALHPPRAVALAYEYAEQAGLALSVVDVALLCGARVAAVAVIVTQQKGTKPETRAPRRQRSQKTEHVQLYVDPQWKHFVVKVGRQQGLDLSSTIRIACWEFVQKHLPKAATEGTRRGPPIEMVRPRVIRKRRRK